jgi:ATP-binding cassette subfamily B protein/subfamily B ATP-binding cassette protein MsbA
MDRVKIWTLRGPRDFVIGQSHMKDWLRALKYFRPDAPRVASVFLLVLGSTALNVLKPWPLALIVDCVVGQKPLPRWIAHATRWYYPKLLAALCAALLLIYLAQAVLSAAQNYLSIQVGLNGLARLRAEMFKWLQRLSMRYHQGARAGDLIYRASWDTYAVQTLFQQGLMTALTAAVSLAVMLVVMARMNIYLTLLSVALAPLLVLGIKSFGARMRDRTTLAQQSDSRVTSLLQQGIATLALTQSYTREDSVAEAFAAQVKDARNRRLSQHGWELAYWLVVAVVFALGTAAITWLGVNQVFGGRLSVGRLLVFLAYLAQFFEPLNQLSHVGATVAGATAGARRVFEILDTPEEIREKPDARPLQVRCRGEISFDGVSFAYERDRPVLRDIRFTLRPGESAAVIGPSGAGKTTLLHLLPRFFDPSAGLIKIDGIDLRDFRLRDLRGQIALLQQEPVILPGTIAENIGFGRPGATQAEIAAAARAANANGFIDKLPQKYETVVGDGAARLSAGEQQRIHLARAFLKDAPILLLDEPTSALDAESEALIARSLAELTRNRTTLIVAHRPATLAGLTRAFHLRDGVLAECSIEEAMRIVGHAAG